MIHGSWTSASDSKSFERGARLTAFCKYNASITGSKSKKYIFYVSFLKRYKGIIKDNFNDYLSLILLCTSSNKLIN